jgi:hypothetical protein
MANKKTKKATKSPKRTKVLEKPTPTPTPVIRSNAARAHIAEGTRLFALAGRPRREQFILVYGKKGPTITWVQRAAAGVDAEHFQEALMAKF